MTNDLHDKAMGLIVAAQVEGITKADRNWLNTHLEDCTTCTALAESTERAIRSLRAVSVQVNPELLDRTRHAVHLRARELHVRQSQLLPLWMSCALSWVLGGLTLPLVWQGVEWVGKFLKLPDVVWVLVLILWWALPTLAVAAIFTARGSHPAGER